MAHIYWNIIEEIQYKYFTDQMSQKKSNIRCSETQKNMERPSKYAKIPYEKRIELINSIENKRLTIKEAAKLFEINQSTAKFIYKCYKSEGKVFQKKTDKVKREIVQQCHKQLQVQPPMVYNYPPPQPYIWPNYQPVVFSYFYPS